MLPKWLLWRQAGASRKSYSAIFIWKRPSTSSFTSIGLVPLYFSNDSSLEMDDRYTIVKMMKSHGRLHPLIPRSDGTWLTKESILRIIQDEFAAMSSLLPEAARQYLWDNWYCPEKLSFWCACHVEGVLPTARTTNPVESLWNALKSSVAARKSHVIPYLFCLMFRGWTSSYFSS